MKKVLVIEDDRYFARLLVAELERLGLRVSVAGEGPSGLAAFVAESPDLVLLDLTLPGVSGIEVCRQIRACSEVPIIVLRAASEVETRVQLLRLGADDFIIKGVNDQELAARVEVVMRRAGVPLAAGPEVEVRVGPFVLDPQTQTVRYQGRRSPQLSAPEFRILAALMERAGRVVTTVELARAGWQAIAPARREEVRIYVHRLRQRLAHLGASERVIATVPGQGYCFVALAEGAPAASSGCD
jgi:DNA-binding response OmpR family regulator